MRSPRSFRFRRASCRVFVANGAIPEMNNVMPRRSSAGENRIPRRMTPGSARWRSAVRVTGPGVLFRYGAVTVRWSRRVGARQGGATLDPAGSPHGGVSTRAGANCHGRPDDLILTGPATAPFGQPACSDQRQRPPPCPVVPGRTICLAVDHERYGPVHVALPLQADRQRCRPL